MPWLLEIGWLNLIAGNRFLEFDYWNSLTGNWFLAIDCWKLIAGNRLLEIDGWKFITLNLLLETDCWKLIAGYFLLFINYSKLIVLNLLLAFDCWKLVARIICWNLIAGNGFLENNCWKLNAGNWLLEIDFWKFIAEKWLMPIKPVMSQSWDSHETVMKQSKYSPAEFLNVFTWLLLPATKVYPQMRRSHTWITNIAKSLKSVYVKTWS